MFHTALETMFPKLSCLLLCLSLPALAETPVFGPVASYAALQAPLAIASADFNGDGVLDLAVANGGTSTVSIFLGKGGGAFLPGTNVSLPAGCDPAYLAAGSFTGAPSPDLLAVCPVGGLYVLPNMGGGNFGAGLFTTLPAPAWVGNLMLGSIHPAIGDFNGDGNLDIAIQTFGTDIETAAGAWYLLLGKGTGLFQAPAQLPFSGFLPLSVAAGDFTGDGNLDLVALLSDENGNISLQFATGNGLGKFTLTPKTADLPTTSGSLLEVADVNGDGKLDLVVAGSALYVNILSALGASPASLGASAVTVLLGDGTGGFTMKFNATEGAYMSGAALANILGSGNLDLVETMIQDNIPAGTPPTGAIEVRPGNGDGTFGSPITLPSLSSTTIPTDLAVADFNGDGRPDIAVSSVPAAPLPSFSLDTDLGDLLISILSQFPNGDATVLLNQTPVLPAITSGSAANGATYIAGGLVPGSWAQVKGANLATVTNYIWQSSDFAGLGENLPTNLKGTSVTVNGLPAAVYYVDPAQINFQVPTGVSGTASVQVSVNGSASNTVTAADSAGSPGIFPVAVNGVNYAGGVFTDGKYIGDPTVSSAFRNATPGDQIQLFATGLTISPAGVLVTEQGVSGVSVTIGTVTFPADFAGLVAVGEFQVNFTVPQQFASMPAASYPITIAVNGVSSPATINSVPPGQVVIPIQP